MEDNEYSDKGCPSEPRPRHIFVTTISVKNIGARSSPAPTRKDLSPGAVPDDPPRGNLSVVGLTTETKDSRQPKYSSEQDSEMAESPFYSDGLPYPEPRVTRRPLSQALGTTLDWISSTTKGVSKISAKRKRSDRESKSDPKAESSKMGPLIRLFKKGFASENSLADNGSHASAPSTAKAFSSVSSLTTSSGVTFSGSVTSISSSESDQRMPRHIVVKRELEKNSDILSAPSSPAHLERSIQSKMRSLSELDISTAEDSPNILDYSNQYNERSTARFGSCRDIVDEEAEDSGMSGSEMDGKQHTATMSKRKHPVDVVYVEPMSKPEDGVVIPDITLPQQQTVDMVADLRRSIENLTLQVQKDETNWSSKPDSPSPSHLVQRRHSSDPITTRNATRYLYSLSPGSVTRRRLREGKTTLDRPRSLFEPVEWENIQENCPSWRQSVEDLAAHDQSSRLDASKNRLTSSTLDIRSPTNLTKVVRASSSYVNVHVTAKIDSEDEEYRHLVVKWIHDTEKSYVQSLQTIIKVYMEPLHHHQGAVLEAEKINDIFYQIPEICTFHLQFIKDLSEFMSDPNKMEKIGKLFVEQFTKPEVIESYNKFTGNFMNAKLTVQQLRIQHMSFARFLEQGARDNREKLNLGDLLIKPVQRIPRYVLFIKDLLKHTPNDHPDQEQLEKALAELTTLAEQMNKTEKEASKIDKLRDLAASIDGATQLLAPRRWLVRHDMVIELRGTQQKKDRCIFLFNDLVLCAAVRRKSSFRRNTFNLNDPCNPDLNMRYKFLWQAPLSVCSLSKVQHSLNSRSKRQLDQLQQDLATLTHLSEISKQLRTDHPGLESELLNLQTGLKEALDAKESSEHLFNVETARVNLLVHSNRPPTQYSVVFMDKKTKQIWEQAFQDSKKEAGVQMKNRRVASLRVSSAWLSLHNMEFLHPLSLQPGRMGMKLTCAGAGLPTVRGSIESMWVCRGDQYGGQVCLLHMEQTTKPRLVSSITVCNSEITCLATIPCGPQQEEVDLTTPITGKSFQIQGQAMRSSSEMNILEEVLKSINSEKSKSSENIPKHTAPDLGSQESVSTLTPVESVASPSPPFSPASRRKSTTSPLASVQTASSPNLSRKYSAPTESQTAPADPHIKLKRFKSDLSPVMLHKDTSNLPTHFEEEEIEDQSSTDTDLEVEDAFLSPTGEEEEEDRFTFNVDNLKQSKKQASLSERPYSAPKNKRSKIFSHYRSQTTSSTMEKESIAKQSLSDDEVSSSRSRSHSAPPDPINVLGKADRKHLPKNLAISEDQEDIFSSQEDNLPQHSKSDAESQNIVPKRPFSPLTLKPILNNSNKPDKMAQVWLGTGENCLYIFSVGDNLRSRNKKTTDLGSRIQCIKYFDGNVFVGLGSGNLVVFEQDQTGEWILHSPYMLSLAAGKEPIRCCEPVLGDLWVGRGNRIILVDTHMLTFQTLITLPVTSAIQSMVCVDQGVWLFVENSPTLYLYHASSGKLLSSVDCTSAVSNVLSNMDPILKNHKLSPLRITALLHVKECLIIGTSAGVILMLPLPMISASASSVTGPLIPIALTEGHAGPVNFLASMHIDPAHKVEEEQGVKNIPEQTAPKNTASGNIPILVFSGGEGFQDFVSNMSLEDIPDNNSCVNIWSC